MWEILPWFVRLAIELVAGAIVLSVAIAFLSVVFWILAAICKEVWRPVMRVGESASQRQDRKRRELGYGP